MGLFASFGKGCRRGRVSSCEADMIRRIPVLRFLKEPVMCLNDLYKRHPLGGQPGWYAFVFDVHNFAYWHHGRNRWELVPAHFNEESFLENLGFDVDDLVDNQVLMWNRADRKFRLYVIRTVDDVPGKRDKDGLYLVVGKGVYVVEGGEVKDIISSAVVKWDDIEDKPTTFPSDWNEMENKPTIEKASNATIDIRQGGVSKGAFSLNQSDDVVVELNAASGGDFTGATVRVNWYKAEAGLVTMGCVMPDGLYDESTGFFLGSDLVRLVLDFNHINPLHPLDVNPAGKRVIITDGGNMSFSWNLKDYSSGNDVLADTLIFKREIYIRGDVNSKTVFC